ncbi:hypothetical protein A3H81_03465 [Candidatus Daviesbacteria bacterium RIFCSPLOWO2_02_FULL_38_18]|nr:MAG: hypothetical protein A3H81_03465 [Candidatus Daviesbacteria bacterium RIFCSPLOWO2_02_FULL_38_18]
MGEINENKTTKYTQSLDKMTAVLDKLESIISKRGGNAEAEAAVEAARTAVSTAQSAVSAQAGKDYGVTVSTESTVKNNAKSARNSLHTDLKATHDLVVAARQAVAKAISTTRSELGGKEATGSATQ